MMPRKDGFSLAKDIRSKNPEIPIIFLTAKTLKEDVLEGFRIGADNYVTKPFNSEELLLRVNAILRRTKKQSDEDELEEDEIRIGKYYFNNPLRFLYLKEGDEITEKIKLSPKEALLLKLFCKYRNNVLPRSEALTKIWVRIIISLQEVWMSSSLSCENIWQKMKPSKSPISMEMALE